MFRFESEVPYPEPWHAPDLIRASYPGDEIPDQVRDGAGSVLQQKNGDTREEGVAVLFQRRDYREEKAPARPNPAFQPVFCAAVSGRRYRRLDQTRSREEGADLIFFGPA